MELNMKDFGRDMSKLSARSWDIPNDILKHRRRHSDPRSLDQKESSLYLKRSLSGGLFENLFCISSSMYGVD